MTMLPTRLLSPPISTPASCADCPPPPRQRGAVDSSARRRVGVRANGDDALLPDQAGTGFPTWDRNVRTQRAAKTESVRRLGCLRSCELDCFEKVQRSGMTIYP
ncbi:hypothetical protein CDEST_12554 [Colletotrichum destructivum]|uniref:Uncharacterized protein n=1 Tax=Colletotrichum destructivum TaxID=34406 RepID=A0AAX4IW98_9PEZI|nr:hypothetical protein CDEST_12554 [Colletotrichum destructivum]